MADPWTFSGDEPHSAHAGTVTLVEGSAFCISGQSGDIRPGGPQGLFFRDTRFLSGLELRINDRRPEPLAAERTGPFAATFVLRSQPPGGRADSSLMVTRHRYVGRGMREDLVVRNFGEEPAYCSVQLRCSADFANLFAVKEGRARSEGTVELESSRGGLLFRVQSGASERGLRVASSEAAQVVADVIAWEIVVATRWSPATCAASR